MPNISAITSFIDSYLEKNGKPWIDPIEANRVLNKAGILGDSATRPGLPLRKLLRDGRIPHAYQPSGKRGAWYIPHSGSTKTRPLAEKVSSDSAADNSAPRDLGTLRDQIRSARLEFIPSIVRCLLIAEAPPDSLERFFYYLDVKTADYLFLGIMEALYPESKQQFLASGRPTDLKEKMLRQFQADGFYLLDILDVPIGMHSGSLAHGVPDLIQRVKDVAKLDTLIILIKATTFDAAFSPLQTAGFVNVADIEIPFPGQGWQRVFQTKFRQALDKLKING